jgi:hypothetical protein
VVKHGHILLAWALGLVPLLACEGELECIPDGDDPTELSIGAVSVDGFVELEPGDPMEIFVGLQGGVMLAPALRARGLYPGDALAPRDDPRSPTIVWTVTVDAEHAGRTIVRRSLAPVPDDEETYELGPSFVTVDGYSADTAGELAGTPADVEVTVETCSGRQARHSVNVTPFLRFF